MMQIDMGAVIAIILFLAVQTGTLIFFCGVITTSVKDLDRRIVRIEDKSDLSIFNSFKPTRKEFP